MSDFGKEAAVQGAAAAPPVALSTAAMVGGLSLQEWMFAATLVYVVLQAAYLLWKWYREWRRSMREDRADG